MGVSTDACIAFGVDYQEDLPEALSTLDIGGENDWEHFLAHLAGLAEPDGEYDRDDPRWPAYWDKKHALAEACPLTLIFHCSGDYPMFILAINGTETRASRGYPETLGTEETVLTVAPERVAEARAWCARVGIEWSEPKWLLYSDWG